MKVIFDIGNVLLRYKPMEYLLEMYDGQTAEALYETVFASDEWLMLDAGLLSYEQAAKRMAQKKEEYTEHIGFILGDWMRLLKPIDEMPSILQRLAAGGIKYYYLSNFHKPAFKYITNEYEWFSGFSGGVASCDINITKPQRGIYEHLLNKYGVACDECLFFDDMPENVRAAREAGMHSEVFVSADQCEKKLVEYGLIKY